MGGGIGFLNRQAVFRYVSFAGDYMMGKKQDSDSDVAF